MAGESTTLDLAAAVAAAVAGRTDALDPADERAIDRLGLAYGLCSDFGRVGDLLELFTPDAVWDGREFRMPYCEGSEQIKAHFTAACPPGLRQVHVLERALVTVGDGDGHARGLLYFQAMQAAEGVKAGPVAFGMYQDEYRRTAEGWLFASRTLRMRLVK